MLKWNKLEAYFDADNLRVCIVRIVLSIHIVSSQTISKAKLAEGIAASCCVLLVLNNETCDSTWCEWEIQCARNCSIPLLCIVDTDKQTVRSVVDFYMEKVWSLCIRSS